LVRSEEQWRTIDDMTDLEAMWTEAKSTQDIDRLAEIGNALLDACPLNANLTHNQEHLNLARVTWILGRMEFMRTARTKAITAGHEPFKPSRSNPYVGNLPSSKYGGITPTGRLAYNEPEPASDNVQVLRTAVLCGALNKHKPHAIGDDKWCTGGPSDDVKITD
jgi:hypothetical protein